MNKFLYPLILIGFVIIFFWQFLIKGLLPVPSDTIVGLYHPYRDFYAKSCASVGGSEPFWHGQ